MTNIFPADLSLNWRRLLVLGIAMTVAGCAAAPQPEPVADADAAASTEYRIGPGDTLEVFVWRNPELTAKVPVRPDGKISTPLVRDVVAVGKTPSELAQDIEEELATYIKNPIVNIIVTGFVGAFSQQIRVVGEATNPRALPYRENITLLDVMIEVGGLTEFAAGNSAKIIRRFGGEEKEIDVNLEDLLNDGDINANLEMRPGDILIVPESWF